MKHLPVIACDDPPCGACCTGQAALPVSWYLGTVCRLGDPSSLPPALRAELEALRDRFLAGGFPPDDSPCVWYDAEAKRCKHYHFRPQICRDLEVGGDGCRRWRRHLGIDQAPRYRLVNGRVVRAGD